MALSALFLGFQVCLYTHQYLNPKYAIEITELYQIIAPWAFTKNYQLTFGVTSNSLQTPMAQAFDRFQVILMHNLG